MGSIYTRFLDKHASKIFIAIIVLSILVRVFAIFVTPIEAQDDSIFHILLSREVLEEQTLMLDRAVPPPFYYVFQALSSALTGFELVDPFVRLFPLLFSSALLVVTYFLMKELFPKNSLLQLAGIAFVSANSLLMQYGSVNYLGPVAAVFVLAAFYFLVRFSKTSSMKDLALFSASTIIFSITKLNATILFPAFLAAIIILMLKKNYSKFRVFVYAIIISFASAAWFLNNYFTKGSFLQFSPNATSELVAGILIDGSFLHRLSQAYFNFWGLPPFESLHGFSIFQDTVFFWAFLILFFIAALPLTISVFRGMKQNFLPENVPNMLIVFAIILGAVVWIKADFVGRMLIPVIPLIGVAFVYSLKVEKSAMRNLALVSLMLISFFSIGYNVFTPIYYSGIHDNHVGMYSYIESLHDDIKVLAKGKDRGVLFYSDKYADHILSLNGQSIDLENIGEVTLALKGNNYTHIAVSCHNNPWKDSVLEQMTQKEYIAEIYKDDCGRVFKVK